ncbi:MAG: agmatinase family protein [Flavobacteriales bacterium]|jgi:agmatinase
MSKAEKISRFNPNAAGLRDSDIYGLPFNVEEADVVIVPVPWEVTVSYGSGASAGPAHVLESSYQVDLFHPEFPELWKAGIAMSAFPEQLELRSTELRAQAEELISQIEDGVDVSANLKLSSIQSEINDACEQMNQHVERVVGELLDKGKLVGLLGGDHSTPLGFYRAQAARHETFGILHIDAHMDFRIAFEGFTYSHASVMYNAMSIPQMEKIVQVGIRDFCEEEMGVAKKAGSRADIFFERDNRRAQFEGVTWKQLVDRMIDSLPEKVHISFDIDGLDPTLCPNTGTPVPGGLTFEEATYLLSRVAESRQVIGFDLVEVAPGQDDWNGNVGARLLFHLSGVLARSAGKC